MVGGWSTPRHAPDALLLGMTRYPLYRRLGGPQGRFRRVRKISTSPGFDPRTVQPVASRNTGHGGKAVGISYTLGFVFLQTKCIWCCTELCCGNVIAFCSGKCFKHVKSGRDLDESQELFVSDMCRMLPSNDLHFN